MPKMAVRGRARALALVVLLIRCVPVQSNYPAGMAAGDSTSQSDMLARIKILEQNMRAMHLKIQAFNATAKPADQPADPIPGKPIDRLQALSLSFRHWCDTTTPRVLLSNTAFWFSILAILQWHIRFHLGDIIWYHFFNQWRKHEVKPFLLPRKLGVNILILVAYYDEDPPIPEFLHGIMKGRAFVTAMCLILFDAFVLYYGFSLLGAFLAAWSPRRYDQQDYTVSNWLNPVDLHECDGIDPPKFKATNLYEDLTTPFRKTTAVFLIQAFLAGLYFQELNNDEESHSMKNVVFDRWIIAVVFQLYAGDEQVGEAFNGRFWRHVLQYETGEQKVREWISGFWGLVREQLGAESTSEEEFSGDEAEKRQKKRDEEAQLRKSFSILGERCYRIFKRVYFLQFRFRTEWRLRRLMDLIINSWARSVILYTVPIMVSVETPLDFVKDLTAVMFITILDNTEGKSVKEILVKLKFNLFYQNGEDDDIHEACALSNEERRHIDDNFELYDDISMLAPREWDDFIGPKGPA